MLINRKSKRATLAVLVIMTLVVNACSSSKSSQQNGTKTSLTAFVVSADLNLFDPMVAGAANTQGPIMQLIYDGLVQFPPGKTALDSIAPALATKWTTSPDGKTWTFDLRKNVQFQGGYGTMTADDVVFSYQRQMDPKAGGSYASEYANVESVSAADPNTVVFHLKKADPYFLVSVANYHGGYIVSKAAVQKLGKNFTTHPIGTGAFALKQYLPANRMVFAANDKYWGGAPKLKEINYLFVADSSAQLTSLQSGGAQVGRVAQSDAAVKAARSAGLVVDLISPINWNLHLNLEDVPAFKDLRVRQALAYGTDRVSLAKHFGSEVAKPSDQLLPTGVLGGLQTVPPQLQYPYDPDKAKALLAAAGFPNLSFNIEVSETSVYPVMWQVLQQQWAKIGVKLKLKTTDHETFNTDADKKHLPMVVHGGSRVPIADLFLREWYSAGGTDNFSHYGDALPGIDGTLDEALADTVKGDAQTATQLYQQAQTKLLTDLPAIPLVQINTPVVRSKSVNLGYTEQDSLVYAYQIVPATTLGGG